MLTLKSYKDEWTDENVNYIFECDSKKIKLNINIEEEITPETRDYINEILEHDVTQKQFIEDLLISYLENNQLNDISTTFNSTINWLLNNIYYPARCGEVEPITDIFTMYLQELEINKEDLTTDEEGNPELKTYHDVKKVGEHEGLNQINTADLRNLSDKCKRLSEIMDNCIADRV